MPRRAVIALLLACLVAAPAAAQTHRGRTAKGHSKAAPAETHSTADPIVARVNGTPLHRSQVLALRAMLPPQLQQQPIEKVYGQLLNEMMSLTLVTQAAHRARTEDSPGVRGAMEIASDQVLQDAYFNAIVKKEITPEKLRTRYAEYVKTTAPQEEIEARHILVPTEAEAKDLIAQLKKGADFATLAREKTTDPAGKASGGDLGWFSRQDMVPAFADAAFKLKKGQFTQTPVHTQFGWHVILVEDRRQGKAPSYDQIAPKLAQLMAREIAAARIKTLAASAKIEVFNPDGSPRVARAPQAAPGAGPRAAAAPQPMPAAASEGMSGPSQGSSSGSSFMAPFGSADGGIPAGVPRMSPATLPQNLGQP